MLSAKSKRRCVGNEQKPGNTRQKCDDVFGQDPPETGESHDLWLKESLRNVFDGLRPAGSSTG